MEAGTLDDFFAFAMGKLDGLQGVVLMIISYLYLGVVVGVDLGLEWARRSSGRSIVICMVVALEGAMA
jgi:hypothetical protein